MKIDIEDIKAEDSTYAISLTKLTGLKIKDITGYITTEFGEPVFKLCDIVFENGAELGCEGEHDLPYLTVYGADKNKIPNFTNEDLQEIYEQQ